MNIGPFIDKNKYLIILIVLGVFFVIIYSWLYHDNNYLFSSPDETANYAFINNYIDTGKLSISDTDIGKSNDLLHPRSTLIVNNELVPGSFIGMIIIYGLIGKIFGVGIILYLTPFFAVMGVIFYFLFLKNFFNKKIAFVSSLMLYIFPTYWLYSARGMFHNIFFLSLLFIGLFLLFKSINSEKNKFIFSSFSGIIIGMSLFVRSSEFLWVAMIIIIIYIFSRKNISLKNILFFLLPLVIIGIVIMTLNISLYGSVTSFGYSESSINTEIESTNSLINFELLGKIISPFGFDFKLISQSINDYLIFAFPWFGIFLVITILFFVYENIKILLMRLIINSKKINPINRNLYYYKLIFFISVVLLIIYYGSFEFLEYLDNSFIYGSSYLRYWLPIYIFGFPIMLILIIEFLKNYKNKLLFFVKIFFICTIIISSILIALKDPLYGIQKEKINNSNNVYLVSQIRSIIEDKSIIISGKADKLFFPNYNVIYALSDDIKITYNALNGLLEDNSIYLYYNVLDKVSVQNYNFLVKNNNFKITPIFNINNNDVVLYQIK
ncbi:MAG: hypothetical protein Q8P20_02755 [bacterium]|nr:hypothetical protein [bacterium]